MRMEARVPRNHELRWTPAPGLNSFSSHGILLKFANNRFLNKLHFPEGHYYRAPPVSPSRNAASQLVRCSPPTPIFPHPPNPHRSCQSQIPPAPPRLLLARSNIHSPSSYGPPPPVPVSPPSLTTSFALSSPLRLTSAQHVR
ncbi:hypothetical protein ASPSYDRAFT_1140269 [Aspergillus sydowii CBS 593.65]|uniref:Uncharacterized protein n=1 Tax=Aspergillus sydowii CBS 593.65 TaxID=1036612 RepID=A0A1L9TAK6_9EURO|nr:uncharacterized protein ASPSYDRAFT_1140269 [Aspergillus sydowii CBS 593.65]OJJ56452.1 hypothetical protein ASPSYDRAFT_1140269 [Aspergillus sydowii CBS 593.65]